jgi:hypothetical protein
MEAVRNNDLAVRLKGLTAYGGQLANPARWCKLTVVTWAFASACLAVTQTDADPADPENPAKNGSLEVHLATLPGFADDAAFLASVTSRVAELQQQAGEATDKVRKTGFLLAAANLILAEQLEPPSSRKFLQLDKPQLGDDALVAARALDRADALLFEAETFLRAEQKGSTDENPPPTDQAKDLSRIMDTLKAFAQALRAYLVTEADGDSSRAARRAASGLSVIVEDDDPQIAAAAAFWQACLRAMDPDPTPALDILDRAIVDLPADAPRFGFFSRLLRCRLVAARGGPAAALALLMQVEERANGWFKAEPDRASAMRSCAWIRLRILQAWHDRLDAKSQDDDRTWCKSRIDTLRNERFSNASGATLLRLNQAIPIIARPPGPNATPPEGTPPPP